jgi:2-polyprenyl-6-methoxyphenol hydroxylase-like FAD-dependent oxidoreductase
MSRILVLGSGLTGLTTALLLARDGHDVTVLERDPAPPPDGADAAWAGWARPGVAQFRQLHFLLPRWRAVMAAEVPEVLTAMLAAGACRTNSLHQRRAEATGGWRPGDERFDAVTARRPVIEAAVASVAAGTPGVTVRRGVRVAGLVRAGRSSVPQVVGVRTEDGDLSADLVVDATGRNGRTTAWITEAGGLAPAETTADSGFRYYARHYRARAGRLPEGRDVALTHYASVSLLTLAADNATFGLGIVTSANDRALRPLQRVERWEAAMRSYPAVEHWLDAEPITDVTVFGGLADRRRSFVVDGRPVVTGLVAVGDAWACTNPSLGRGVSIGALHACVLRDAVAKEGLGDADALARRFHEETERGGRPLRRRDAGVRPAPAGHDRGGRHRRRVRARRPELDDGHGAARRRPPRPRAGACPRRHRCAARHAFRGLRRPGRPSVRPPVGGPPVADPRPYPRRAARRARRHVEEVRPASP